MVKSCHFCTEELVEGLENPSTEHLVTHRTFWIPTYLLGEKVKLLKRNKDGQDEFICFGECICNFPLQYKNIDKCFQNEIKRYGRKFKNQNWFFRVIFKKLNFKKEGQD